MDYIMQEVRIRHLEQFKMATSVPWHQLLHLEMQGFFRGSAIVLPSFDEDDLGDTIDYVIIDNRYKEAEPVSLKNFKIDRVFEVTDKHTVMCIEGGNTIYIYKRVHPIT